MRTAKVERLDPWIERAATIVVLHAFASSEGSVEDVKVQLRRLRERGRRGELTGKDSIEDGMEELDEAVERCFGVFYVDQGIGSVSWILRTIQDDRNE